jgi:hypothetical protein
MTLAPQAEKFAEALIAQGPAGISIKFDAGRMDGVVFIDIDLEGASLTVEWLPKVNGYGVCDCGDPGYGDHRDHVLELEEMVPKALEILTAPGKQEA